MWKLFVVLAALASPPSLLAPLSASAALARDAVPATGVSPPSAPADAAAREAWFARAVTHILAAPESVGRSSSAGPNAPRPR